MSNKCASFKENNTEVKFNLPFKYKIVEKERHVCVLFKKNICKFANSDCKNINGKLIKIEDKLTISDVRLIKWLTGFTVDCDFEEIQYIDKRWKKE